VGGEREIRERRIKDVEQRRLDRRKMEKQRRLSPWQRMGQGANREVKGEGLKSGERLGTSKDNHGYHCGLSSWDEVKDARGKRGLVSRELGSKRGFRWSQMNRRENMRQARSGSDRGRKIGFS